MKSSWTGGQYSLYRAVFGIYLLIHFAALIPSIAGVVTALMLRQPPPDTDLRARTFL